jgi:hypothetical protein
MQQWVLASCFRNLLSRGKNDVVAESLASRSKLFRRITSAFSIRCDLMLAQFYAGGDVGMTPQLNLPVKLDVGAAG